MSATTINVADWWLHRDMQPEQNASLQAWVEGVMGQPLGWEQTLTLGEGVLVVGRLTLDDEGHVAYDPATHETFTETVTLPAPVPPPCWPAGLAARSEPNW